MKGCDRSQPLDGLSAASGPQRELVARWDDKERRRIGSIECPQCPGLRRSQWHKQKWRPRPPPACLPPRQPSVFPGYLCKELIKPRFQKIIKRKCRSGFEPAPAVFFSNLGD